MGSFSVLPSSLFLPGNTRFLNHRFNLINHFRARNSKIYLSSISMQNLEVSWLPPGGNVKDDYNGWAVSEEPIDIKKKKGLPTFVLVGIGSSVVALLATVSHFSLSRKGFVFRFSSPFHGVFMPSGTNKVTETRSMGSDASSTDMVSEAISESVFDMVNDSSVLKTSDGKREEAYLGRIIIPVAPDAIQQEALLALKKLKIIEDDVVVDELCTRREYARWLARANLLLERNRKHQIVPSIALVGSTISAFDDVGIDDPDFVSIQSLAETGIVLSKLSCDNSSSTLDDLKSQEVARFFPERFISRQDLINWKAKLDYEVMPGINEEITRNNLGFMDAREISSDALVLFIDLLAGDKSIIRTVFGQGKRFQPNKPCTKAQAAVALTSGRMSVAICTELSRLEAENSSRQIAMDEIRSELLERGEIQRYWDKKIIEVKNHGIEVEKGYIAAIQDLEEENIVKEKSVAEHLKEKAAVECQKQLLSSLKEEIDEMSKKLLCERTKYVDEQQSLQYMLGDTQVKYDGLLDAKSVLESEIEALRILRTWIEDEARKSQARAKVLEEASRRWKWSEQS